PCATGSVLRPYLPPPVRAVYRRPKRGRLPCGRCDVVLFFFSSRRRHTRCYRDWSSDVCSSDLNGPFLGGQGFSNAGVPQIGPGTGAAAPLDLGRGGIKGNDFYKFAFRIAPLRNVELTAPYMHDGAFATLEAVVRHYNDVPLALRTYDVSQLAPELRAAFHGDATTIDTVLAT